MQILTNQVLLLKSLEEDTNTCIYTDTLNKNGFSVCNLKILEFNFINLDALYEKLENPDRYQGLIFTSPRSVTATKLSLKDKQLPDDWRTLTNYVIGQNTYKTALNELNLDCSGSETGNAANLASVIIQDAEKIRKPFLFPCGNLKRDVLQKCLNEAQIALDTTIVYETIRSRTLEEGFRRVTSDFTTIQEYIVFFSPSGVRFVYELLKNFVDNSKLIAIGPTTAEEITKVGWRVHGQAEKPSADYLLTVILK